MDTAEPLTRTPKKRRVSWIDERLKKPLHEVKYIAKENVGKKVHGKISSDTEGDMCGDTESDISSDSEGDISGSTEGDISGNTEGDMSSATEGEISGDISCDTRCDMSSSDTEGDISGENVITNDSEDSNDEAPIQYRVSSDTEGDISEAEKATYNENVSKTDSEVSNSKQVNIATLDGYTYIFCEKAGISSKHEGDCKVHAKFLEKDDQFECQSCQIILSCKSEMIEHMKMKHLCCNDAKSQKPSDFKERKNEKCEYCNEMVNSSQAKRHKISCKIYSEFFYKTSVGYQCQLCSFKVNGVYHWANINVKMYSHLTHKHGIKKMSLDALLKSQEIEITNSQLKTNQIIERSPVKTNNSANLIANSPDNTKKGKGKSPISTINSVKPKHQCELCGFEPNSRKNKNRGRIDHLILKHFKEEIDKMLPNCFPWKCPISNCSVVFRDQQTLRRHYTQVHEILKDLLSEALAAKNLPSKDLPSKDLPFKDLPFKDLPSKDLPLRDLQSNNLPSKDLSFRDLPSKDLPSKDLPSKNLQSKDPPSKDFSSKEDSEIFSNEKESQLNKKECEYCKEMFQVNRLMKHSKECKFYVKFYKKSNDGYTCTLCSNIQSERLKMYRHIRNKHKNAIPNDTMKLIENIGKSMDTSEKYLVDNDLASKENNSILKRNSSTISDNVQDGTDAKKKKQLINSNTLQQVTDGTNVFSTNEKIDGKMEVPNQKIATEQEVSEYIDGQTCLVCDNKFESDVEVGKHIKHKHPEIIGTKVGTDMKKEQCEYCKAMVQVTILPKHVSTCKIYAEFYEKSSNGYYQCKLCLIGRSKKRLEIYVHIKDLHYEALKSKKRQEKKIQNSKIQIEKVKNTAD